MEFVIQLWLPILVSAVIVFVASSIIHMATPMHKGDVRKLDNEDEILDALRSNDVQPGAYMFPCGNSMKEMGEPEMLAKFERGPVGWLTVLPPGGFNMGRSLAQWFVFCLIVGFFSAYVGWYALGAGAEYKTVFRVVGTAAILGYAIGYFQDPI